MVLARSGALTGLATTELGALELGALPGLDAPGELGALTGLPDGGMPKGVTEGALTGCSDAPLT